VQTYTASKKSGGNVEEDGQMSKNAKYLRFVDHLLSLWTHPNNEQSVNDLRSSVC